jgi:hypothetical protein
LGYRTKHNSDEEKATLDHMFDPKRKKFKLQPAVNACFACNQKRGKEAEEEFLKNGKAINTSV